MEHSRNAVVVIGHGSRSPEAKVEFLEVTNGLAARMPHACVLPAFMELAEPSFEQAVSEAVASGASRILVVPCFLFYGNHLKKDIPELVAETGAKFPAVEFVIARHLGPDPRIEDVLAARIDALLPVPRVSPAEIERRSMELIERSNLSLKQFGDDERALVKRLVHTTGDLSVAAAVRLSPDAVSAGVAALRRGCAVVTDVKMVAVGINQSNLKSCGSEVLCGIDHPEVAVRAEREHTTRSEAAMHLFAEKISGGIVAIGNAPTALRAVVAMARDGVAKPALVIGMPVGFVDAAESKEALLSAGIPFVTVVGSRGGSPLAAASVNAIARLLCDHGGE
jgi:precorrin-8X/cobalt-precorrin-8 methylmutase